MHGVRGDFTDYRGASRLKGRNHCRITALQTGALPYFEVPSAFCNEYAAFLRSVLARSAVLQQLQHRPEPLVVARAPRLLLWNPIAVRWASSRTRWRR